VKIWRGGTRRDRDRADPQWWKDTGATRSASSANHYLDCLRASLGAAHDTRDRITGNPMLPFPPKVKAFHAPERLPTPMPDGELEAREAVARPWTRDAAELACLFGLRHAEATAVKTTHVRTEIRDGDPYHFLFFKGEEVKGGNDQVMHGGWAGSDLLERPPRPGPGRRPAEPDLLAWPALDQAHGSYRGETTTRRLDAAEINPPQLAPDRQGCRHRDAPSLP
jgi:hypothetical protein